MANPFQDLLAAAEKLNNADKKVAEKQAQAEAIEKANVAKINEAEKQARKIITEAEEKARLATFNVEKQQAALAQRLADVASREKAVVWVDTKLAELNAWAAQLADKEKALAQATSEASAAKDSWTTRQAELNAQEAAINEALANLSKAAPEEAKKITKLRKKKE
jgi:uncharacterized protein YdeI (YjbR/CyaY-like superfamily)